MMMGMAARVPLRLPHNTSHHPHKRSLSVVLEVRWQKECLYAVCTMKVPGQRCGRHVTRRPFSNSGKPPRSGALRPAPEEQRCRTDAPQATGAGSPDSDDGGSVDINELARKLSAEANKMRETVDADDQAEQVTAPGDEAGGGSAASPAPASSTAEVRPERGFAAQMPPCGSTDCW